MVDTKKHSKKIIKDSVGDKCEVVEELYGKIEVIDNNGDKCEGEDIDEHSKNKVARKNKKHSISTDKQFVEDPKQQIKAESETKKESSSNKLNRVVRTIKSDNKYSEAINPNDYIDEKENKAQKKSSKFWVLTMVIGLILLFTPLVVNTDETIICVFMIASILFLNLTIILLYIRRGKKKHVW